MRFCPNCGAELDHLVKVAYRDVKPKTKVKVGESKYKHVRKLDFCCPHCGLVLARSYKKARKLLETEK